MQENSTINLLRSLHDLAAELADADGHRLADQHVELAALGAKVRAALSAPTIKVATPRVLQSADEAPCGSLINPRWNNQPTTVRLPSGRGYHLGLSANGGLAHDRPGWKWHEHSIAGSVSLLAAGLTEDECRHLSGLSAADAIAWCEKRQAALHVPTTCDKDTTYWLQVAKERAESTAATKGGVLEATRTALRTEPDACIIRTAEQVRALADEALQVRAGAADKARGDVAAREETVARQVCYLRTVDAAREADDVRDAERKRLGLLPIGPSLVLTPDQSDALHAGSLTLADVLPPDPWAEMLGITSADHAKRLDEACGGTWGRLSDFGVRCRVDWSAAEVADRLRKVKKRADRKRTDRRRRRSKGKP